MRFSSDVIRRCTLETESLKAHISYDMRPLLPHVIVMRLFLYMRGTRDLRGAQLKIETHRKHQAARVELSNHVLFTVAQRERDYDYV